VSAGASRAAAGNYTGIATTFQRGDGQQRTNTVSVTLPRGLAAMISHVPLCEDPQAASGDCPERSRIGRAEVTAGPGGQPLVVPQPGQPEAPIYLTGPYKGAPFGLTIVTQVIAGPFNLGTIVTRAKVEVDPTTAQVTVTTDSLPQIIDGVPTDLRMIRAVIDRPEFAFDPTNCEPMSMTALLTGVEGAQAALASPFQVESCRALGFKPSVSATTGPRSSRLNGASLKIKLSYPQNAFGSQSWFRNAKFTIPKQLPARLTTLHQACLSTVFDANPAACPAHSKIGTAVVHTPVLPVPLTGAVYFVSFGSEKFPDVVIKLEGDNVAIELRAETLIKNGVTSATFRDTPDVPFENIEVSLPAGPFSEFGGNLPAKAKESFCGQKLSVGTQFTAQNGLESGQPVSVKVENCKKKTRKNKGSAKRHSARKH
jgi:hypothetical protein